MSKETAALCATKAPETDVAMLLNAQPAPFAPRAPRGAPPLIPSHGQVKQSVAPRHGRQPFLLGAPTRQCRCVVPDPGEHSLHPPAKRGASLLTSCVIASWTAIGKAASIAAERVACSGAK